MNAAPAEPLRGTRHALPVPALARKCSELLKSMFDEPRSLFAYSTRIKDGRFVNDFSHPALYRYTINAIAGIQQAKFFHELDWNVDKNIEDFLGLNWLKVNNAADNGLLLYVLAAACHPDGQSQLSRVERVVNDENGLTKLNLQEICWMLAGLTKYAEVHGDPRSESRAKKCWSILDRYYFNHDTFLPFHSLQSYRRGLTSFGGVAYFLWSVFHYARVFEDREARTIFQEGVRRVTALQGPRGEWPWFINANDAVVLDWYQLYSVHQDSMAMLFLLPALDSGIAEARTAIRNSYRWLWGNNELGAVMILDNPFFIYRSIRQKTTFERGQRYLRALGSHSLGWRAKPLPASCLEINHECRSYHIGWLLFAWAGTHGFEEFTELQVLQ